MFLFLPIRPKLDTKLVCPRGVLARRMRGGLLTTQLWNGAALEIAAISDHSSHLFSPFHLISMYLVAEGFLSMYLFEILWFKFAKFSMLRMKFREAKKIRHLYQGTPWVFHAVGFCFCQSFFLHRRSKGFIWSARFIRFIIWSDYG